MDNQDLEEEEQEEEEEEEEVDDEEEEEDSTLHDLAEAGDTEGLISFLAIHPEDVNKKQNVSKTFLFSYVLHCTIFVAIV